MNCVAAARQMCGVKLLHLPSHSSRLLFLSLTPNTSSCLQPASVIGDLWGVCVCVWRGVAVVVFVCLFLYSAILHSQADSLHFCCMCFYISDCSFFIACFFSSHIHRSGVLTTLFGCCLAGAMWNCNCHGVFCVQLTNMHYDGVWGRAL